MNSRNNVAGTNATLKSQLVDCVKALYDRGLSSSLSGNHSFLANSNLMWITPSGVFRYLLQSRQLVKVDIRTGKYSGTAVPSREWRMHALIYLHRADVKAIVHCHSPYTLAVAEYGRFPDVLEEARAVIGEPVIVPLKRSGSEALAKIVSKAFGKKVWAVIIKRHGVVAAGKDIPSARAVVESLEEWAKVISYSKLLKD